MVEIKIERENAVLASKIGSDEIYLIFNGEYIDGDSINITFSESGYYSILLDQSLGKANIFTKGGTFSFPIPFGQLKNPYNPNSFLGDKHYIYVKKEDASYQERNLSYNPYDVHTNSVIFPHASANVETRGEAVFFARNAIDGMISASGHGKWPYASWGINKDPNAKLFIDFGREVEIEAINLYLRADFPHDAYWERVTIELKCKDESKEFIFNTKKLDGKQSFEIDKTIADKLILKDLIKAEDPSPFPALTQIEVIGKDIK